MEKIEERAIDIARCTDCQCYSDCHVEHVHAPCGQYDEAFKKATTQFLSEDKMPTPIAIETCLDSMKHLLIQKNMKYGNSALEPINVFSKLDSQNSICIRLDDKLSRIRNSKELRKNDVADMIGYLTLLCVANEWTNFEELID